MPIRKLVERAGPALQALKPVFMMSPLSVAQFLAPGSVEFDLLVMDEASQIQPVDALGAVARARQVVVVGDPRQLPPTAFFARMTGGGDEDEDDGSRVRDVVGAAINVAVLKGSILRDGDFVSIDGRQAVLRDRSVVTSPGLRKPEAIPIDEIAAGAVALVIANYGAPADQLVTEIARGLGFKATSDGLRRRIADGIELAQRDGRLEEQNELFQAVLIPSDD